MRERKSKSVYPLPSWARTMAWLIGWATITTLLVLIGRAVIPVDRVSHDYICYWAAGKILAAGGSPYDPQWQIRVQQEYGWDKETDGLGRWDYLPYYYPPSLLAPLCVLFVPLSFPTAKIAWLVFNAELLLISGYLLRDAVEGVPRSIPMVVAPIFAFSFISALVGQLAPLILFLIVVTWRLLERRWDRSAGWMLAWMMIKPQLTVVLLPAMLLWAVRQRRWRVIEGFATGLAVLLVLSTLVAPSWPVQLFRGPIEVEVPTAERPWKGATWLLALRTTGLEGWPLWGAYAAAVVPMLIAVWKTARDRRRSVGEVLAVSLLAAFFVAPYGRSYDFPVLLIPLLFLLGQRLPDVWGAVLLVVFVLLPYLHWWWIAEDGPHHISFFWVPLLLALIWLASSFKSRQPGVSASDS